MKKILSDFLGLPIESYTFRQAHDFRIEKEHDYGNSYDVITGEVYQPQYEVIDEAQNYHFVDFEELLVFIYNKK